MIYLAQNIRSVMMMKVYAIFTQNWRAHILMMMSRWFLITI